MDKLLRNVCALILTTAMMLGIMQGPLTWATAKESKDMVTSGIMTKVSMMKSVNGSWKDATEFQPDDEFQMKLYFSIPSGTYTQGNGSEMYYQLPSGVKVTEEQTGDVVDTNGSNMVIGTYKIDTNGKVTVTFNENFDTNKAYGGYVKFEGKINIDVAEDETKIITFGNGKGSITIKKNDNGGKQPSGDGNKTDSTVKKEAVLSSDKKSITYKVIVSTVKGTGDPVSLNDAITWVNNITADYDKGSFSLIKKKANGSSEKVSYNADQLNITDNGNDKQKFTLNNLPKLDAGESYELTYKVNVHDTGDGMEQINNEVQDNKNHNAKVSLNISNRMGNKHGNVTADRLEWTIDVNEDRRDLSSYQLNDILPDGYHLVENIVVKDIDDNSKRVDALEVLKNDANKVGTKKINVDFSKVPSDKKNHKFQIVYWTNVIDATTPGDSKLVTNRYELKNNDHTYSGEAPVTYQPFKVNKTSEDSKNTITDNKRINHWKAQVEMSAAYFNEFTYKDIIDNAKDQNGNDRGPDSHYAIAATLYNEIKDSINLIRHIKSDYGPNVQEHTDSYVTNSETESKNDYKWVLTCYDANKQEVKNTDTTSHVKSFTLKLIANKDYVKPTEMNVSYTTIGDIANVNEGDTVKYGNTGGFLSYDNKHTNVPDSHSESSYTNEHLIEKLASPKNDGNQFANSLNTKITDLDEENGKKILYYRILLNIKPSQNDGFTVKDILPKGLTYIDGSLTAGFYHNPFYSASENYNSNNYNFSGKDKPSVDTKKNDDGTTTITIGIKGGYRKDGDTKKISLNYKVVVSDDDDWKNMKLTSKTYTNKVEWNGASTSQVTKVDREVKDFEKKVVQESQKKGDQTKWLNTLDYYLPINPGEKDLNPNGDTLTLVDQMKVPAGVTAYLDLNSVKLCKYDAYKENAVGKEVDKSLYTFTYDNAQHKMSLEIPDSKGFVLVYKYNVDPDNVQSPQISNDAELAGKYKDSASLNMSVQKSGSVIWTKTVKIKKVDSRDYSKPVPGAKFEAYKRVNNSWQNVNLENPITNDKGEINIESFDRGGLYKIKEVVAPSGYAINNKDYYVVMIPEDNASLTSDYEKSYYDNNIDQAAQGEIKGMENITFVGGQGATILVPETFTELSVDKSWVNQDGTKANPGAKKIHLSLYKYKKGKPTVTVTLNMHHSSSWLTSTKYSIAKGSNFTVKITSKDDASTIVDENGVDRGKEYTVGPINEDKTINVSFANKDGYSANADYTPPQEGIDYDHGTEVKGKDVYLSADNQWKHTWTDLGHEDGVYYGVKEDPVDGYKTTYRNNGITAGTIHVVNTSDKKKEEQYTLPSTGGKGTTMFYAAGVLLISLASFLLIRRYKHLNERG